MAMLDGKPHTYGANLQREKFGREAKAAGSKNGFPVAKKADAKLDGEPTTTITHHADGTHSAEHSDGEHSEHPHIGHLSMALHAKHSDGEAMHVHQHGAGVTTHHVGMDGTVEGPHEHGSVEGAADHMKQMLGEDGGNGSIETSDGEPEHGMENLY